MHYYKRNLGDYAKKCGRLSMLEHGAYTLLIDSCYDREQFPTLSDAIDWCWARSEAEIDTVKFVLSKFFTLEGDVYVQKRIKEELDEYHLKAVKNKEIATEREERRREKARTVHEPLPEQHEAPPNQEPRTKNQEPIIKGTNVPLCPQQKIKDLYVEKLSEWLPSIKIWSDARAKALQARWKFMLTASRSDGTRFAKNEEEGLAMFAKFFDFVAASDFLCGRKDGSGFVADIDFLLTPSKFIRVIEGFYSNKNNEVKS